MSESGPSEAQLSVIFHYGAYSVWQLVERVFALDVREVCSRVAIEQPILKTNTGSYRVDLVPSYYLGPESPDVDCADHIAFLLNSVNVVFNMLKEGVVREGKHILGPYGFQLDECRNLELVLLASEEDLRNICYAARLDTDTKLGVVYTPESKIFISDSDNIS